MVNRIRTLVACFVVGLVLPSPASAAFITFEVGGDNTAASIQASVDQFRANLGNPNNGNAPGPLAGGRREINWDGGGSVVASPAGNPFAGFQNNRGALFTTPGTGFLQTPLNDVALTSLNPTYATTFGFFSPVRIFTSLGSNITDVTFFIPGSLTPATVSGFGAVFTDVDLGDSASLEFFDIDGNLLFSDNVLAGTVADGSLSFLGASATAGERIFRVRITSGTTALGPNDNPTGGVDVVAMDDFIYAEPLAVPEPSILLLLGVGLIGWVTSGARARRRQ